MSNSDTNSPYFLQEEFMSAFGEQVSTLRRQEQVQQELETCTEDMDK